MADALRMEVLEGVDEHVEVGAGHLLLKPSAECDVLKELSSLRIFEDNGEDLFLLARPLPVDGFGTDIVKADDVGMLQPLEDAHLVLEVSQIGGVLLVLFDGV